VSLQDFGFDASAFLPARVDIGPAPGPSTVTSIPAIALRGSGAGEVTGKHLIAAGIGRPEDFPAGGLAGDIALIERGDLTFAQKVGKSAGQLALLWCKDQPGITAPIYGPRTMEQLKDVLPILEMQLSDEERAFCDMLNPPGSVVVNFHNTAPWMKTKIG